MAEIHGSFSTIIALNVERIQLVISKYQSKTSLYIFLTKNGFSKKKIFNYLEKELLLVTNTLSTNYGGHVNILNSKQSRLLLRFLKKKKNKVPIDFSSLVDAEIDVMDILYRTIAVESFPDISLVMSVKKKESTSNYFTVYFSALSDNSKSLKRFLHATNTFKKMKTSSAQDSEHVHLDELPKYFHIPLDYQGTSTTTQSRRKPIFQQDQSLLLGYEYINELLDDEISINIGELLYNVEIYGMIGRGKTSLVSSIIEHLIHNNIPSLIFDIKGEYATTFTTESNVEIFTIGPPHPICINLFDTRDEDDVRGTLLLIEEMIASSDQNFSPSMKNLFETALFLTHKEEKRTLEVFAGHLITLAKRNKRVTTIQNTLDAVLNRLNFIFNPSSFEILGVSQTTLNFDVMEQGKTIILDLSQFQRRAAKPSDIYLVCNLILKLFYKFASSKDLTNKLRYVVVLEEAINIIPHIYRTQSSASLITAENNILLGRSLGIGHIFCTQMWHSVSRIVHANSSTKIVFRSCQETEKIAKALNLHDFHFERLQQLPIRHCFVWKDGQHKAIEMVTKDFNRKPLNYNHYLLFLKRKYSYAAYPLLFNSFIDMRTSLYDKLTQRKHNHQKKEPKKKNIQQTESNKQNPKNRKTSPKKQPFIQDDVCKTFCSLSKNQEECSKIRKDAEIVSSIMLKRYSKFEIEQAILGELGTSLEDLLKQVLKEKKLNEDDKVVYCAQRELTNQLMKIKLA
ncbi:MAG: ATP-binding protein [Candidatus Heimdallarchaeota archaeon]|nr:ATP-binding protein [Candidatus Heimdallarchaeota archaeon]